MTHKLNETLLVITLTAVAVRNITKKIPKNNLRILHFGTTFTKILKIQIIRKLT